MMNLEFNNNIASEYKSASQQIRILTEDWVAHNSYCPICGEPILNHYEANRPVADFYCNHCKSDFELKSKKSHCGSIGKKVVDGAFETMIQRITSLHNPNFFFMTYFENCVTNFFLIPSHFFTSAIIEKRKPLSANARRANWVGCNIKIDNIPDTGKIFLVKNGKEIDKSNVVGSYERAEGLRTSNLSSRGWIMDILNCVEKIRTEDFTLQQVYQFEPNLQMRHPDNNFVKDKIRQQLQYLRDKGFIEFTARGNYRKIKL